MHALFSSKKESSEELQFIEMFMTHISVETIRVIKTEVWDEMYTALILCLIVVYAVYLMKNGTKGF